MSDDDRMAELSAELGIDLTDLAAVQARSRIVLAEFSQLIRETGDPGRLERLSYELDVLNHAELLLTG